MSGIMKENRNNNSFIDGNGYESENVHGIKKLTNNKRSFGLDLTNANNINNINNINNKIFKKKKIIKKENKNNLMNVEKYSKWDLHRLNNKSNKYNIDKYCTEYIDQVMSNDYNTEKYDNDVDAGIDCYLLQHNLKKRYRFVLVDWLICIHNNFGLKPSTLYLGIDILDNYVKLNTIKDNLNMETNKYQLIGMTCLWIASKYNEIYPIVSTDAVNSLANKYTCDDLFKCEEQILQLLDFKVTKPLICTFNNRFLQIIYYYINTSNKHDKNTKKKYTKTFDNMYAYFTEVMLLNYDILAKNSYSKISEAIFMYIILGTNLTNKTTLINDCKNGELKHNLNELKPIIIELHGIVSNINKKKYNALFKKYCTKKNAQVSKITYSKYLSQVCK